MKFGTEPLGPRLLARVARLATGWVAALGFAGSARAAEALFVDLHAPQVAIAFLALSVALVAGFAVALALALGSSRRRAAEADALRRQAAELLETLDSLSQAQRIAALGSWDWRIHDDRCTWSDEVCRILGIGPAGIAAGLDALLKRVHADDRAAVDAALRALLSSGQASDITYRVVLPGGQLRFVRQNAAILRQGEGPVERVIGTLVDVSEREHTARALRVSEDTLRRVVDGAPIVLWMIDTEGRFLLSEGKGLRELGLEPGQVVGQSLYELYAGLPEIIEDTRRVLTGQAFTSTRQLGAAVFEYRYSPLRDEAGLVKGAVGVAIDVTERKQSEDRLAYLANYDPLTGLPNRLLFGDRLQHAMLNADRQGHRVALLFADLDNFKNINDSLGHAAGDELLKQFALRLGAVVRATDTVCRLGGDEFTIILESIGNDEEAVRVAAQVLEQSARPFDLGARQVYVTTSVGIALYPRDGDSVEGLLMNADAAMYRAKENGRNAFEFFTREINARAHERLELVNELRGAMARGEFSLHYQPQLDAAGNAVLGFEALLRWNNARLGAVAPSVFVPILEDIGLIIEVGAWVLREACCWAAALPASALRAPGIAVNLSARQFRHPQLDRVVQDALHASGLPASRLELEITESILLDLESNLQTMDRLKRLGLGLSIDDFGTGYSSLSYLKRFPVDRLKIDASFVRDVALDPDDAAIVVAIIGLAHHLQLRVIAEGVETKEQMAFLRLHGCDEVQGYLHARPMPGPLAVDWLLQRSTPLRELAEAVPAGSRGA